MYRFFALILFSVILVAVHNSSSWALESHSQSEPLAPVERTIEPDILEQEQKSSVRSSLVTGDKIVSFHISPIQVDTVGYDKDVLPKSLWQGSERGQIEYLIESTSPDASSDVIKRLFTALLLAKSSSLPEGEGRYSNLIDLRLKKLSEVGASKQVIQLAGLIPQSLKNDVVKQIEVYNRIKQQQYDTACPLVKKNLGRKVTSWNGFLLLCQLGQKDYHVAGLTFALLRDAEFFDTSEILKKIELYIESAPSPNTSADDEVFEELIQAVYINSDISNGKYSRSQHASSKKDWSDAVQKRMVQVSRNTEIENELLLKKLQDYKKSNPNDLITFYERLYFVMDGLSGDIITNEWDDLWHRDAISDDLIKRRIEIVSGEEKVGETALLVAKLLEDKKISDINNHTLLLVMQALRRVGLEHIARQMAMEALNIS